MLLSERETRRLLSLIHESVEDHDAAFVAEEVYGHRREQGKTTDYYSKLKRETNPNDDGAKLGLVDFVNITLITKDLTPWHRIAGYFNAMLVPLPDVDPGNLDLAAAMTAVRASAEEIESISRSVEDGRLDERERAEIIEKVGRAQVAGESLKQLLLKEQRKRRAG